MRLPHERSPAALATGALLLLALATLAGAPEGLVALVTLSETQAALPAEVVTHVFVLSNLGPHPETYSLSLDAPPGWRSLGLPSALRVAPGEGAKVFVSVVVPPSALPGVFSLTLTATAQSNADLAASATAWVEVRPWSQGELLPPAGQQAPPGTYLRYAFQLVQHGNVPDAFWLAGRSSHGYEVSVRPSLASLLPGETRPVEVQLHLPAAAPPGPDRLTLRATSLHFPGVTFAADVLTTVWPPPPSAVKGSLFFEVTGHLELEARASPLAPPAGELSLPLALETRADLPWGLQLSLSATAKNLLRPDFNGALSLQMADQGLVLSRQGQALALSLQSPLLSWSVSRGRGGDQRQSWRVSRRFSWGRLWGAWLTQRAVAEQGALSEEDAFSTTLYYRGWPLTFSFNGFSFGPHILPRPGQLGVGLSCQSSFAAPFSLSMGWAQTWRSPPSEPGATLATLSAQTALKWALSDHLQAQLQLDHQRARRRSGAATSQLQRAQTEVNLAVALRASPFELGWQGGIRRLQQLYPAPSWQQTLHQRLSLQWGGVRLSWVADTLQRPDLPPQSRRRLAVSWGLPPLADDLQLALQADAARVQLEATLSKHLGSTRLRLTGQARWGPPRLRLQGTAAVNVPFSLPLPFWAVKGRLEGVAFRDENANRRRDAGEAGVANLILRLGPALARTDASGLYRFPPLPPGDYALELDPASLPAGLLAPPPPAVFLVAGRVTRQDLPLAPVGVVQGLVFEDANGNGRPDPTERGLPRVDVLVQEGAGGVHPTRTGPNGQFALSLPLGRYRLRLELASLPARWTFTTPAEVTVTLEEPGQRRFVVFGLAPARLPLRFAPTAAFAFHPASPPAGQVVTFDASASFDPDGQVVAYAWDFEGDGVVDAGGQVVQHAFPAPGAYQVTLTVTDDQGLRGQATATVEVSESSP